MEPRFTAISLTMLALRSNLGGVVTSLYDTAMARTRASNGAVHFKVGKV